MSLLAAGEGAAGGLEEVLQHMAQEQMRQRALSEGERHNRAEEGLDSQRISEAGMTRRLMETDRADNRAEATAAKEDANVLRRVALRPIGASVTPDEKTTEVKHGIPIGNYTFSPASMGASTPQGEVGPSGDSLTWRGTEDQILKANKPAGGDYNVEQKTVLYKGKPTLVSFDPRAVNSAGVRGTYTHPATGEDISDQVQNYEKPAAPDRVLIQTGNGYMPRAEATDKIKHGENVPLATSSASRTMQEGAAMLRPHIPELYNMAAELDKRGQFGPVASRMRDLMTKYGNVVNSGDPDQEAKGWSQLGNELMADPALNTDELTGQFATSLGLLATGAGRVHGGARGGGSPQMLEHFKALLGSSSTLPMFKGRLKALDSYMAQYAKGPGTDAPAAGGNDPMAGIFQEYLNRKKQ